MRDEVEINQMKNTKLLVVVDESPATKRSLEYVARIAGRGRGFRVCLAHALPSPPPELVELRGAEKTRIRAYKRRWISVVELTEQRALDRANAVLRRGGVAKKAIEAHYCNLVDASRATEEILRLARARKCDTVVIGRESLSWLGELIHGDPAEELVRQGKGFTIWVVE
jgi:nucleotide-binding universal stress UspA family protein